MPNPAISPSQQPCPTQPQWPPSSHQPAQPQPAGLPNPSPSGQLQPNPSSSSLPQFRGAVLLDSSFPLAINPMPPRFSHPASRSLFILPPLYHLIIFSSPLLPLYNLLIVFLSPLSPHVSRFYNILITFYNLLITFLSPLSPHLLLFLSPLSPHFLRPCESDVNTT